MEAPSVPSQIARVVLPPAVVIPASIGAISVDVFLGIGLFLVGSFVAGRISRSWWCPALLFVVPMTLLVLAVDSEWPAAEEDGLAALAVIIGTIVFSIVILVGTLLSTISTFVVRDRHEGRYRTSKDAIYVGQ